MNTYLPCAAEVDIIARTGGGDERCWENLALTAKLAGMHPELSQCLVDEGLSLPGGSYRYCTKGAYFE